MVNLLPAGRTRPACGGVPGILVAGNLAELRRVLGASGYDVTAARSGREALALSAGRPPAAFVLDLALPDTVGTELIAELRRWHSTPIIALSSPASTADKIAALDAGADQYVTAPFPMDEFLARLRAVLRRDKGNLIRGKDQSVIGHWQVDLAAHQLTCADAPASPPPAGTPRLTPTEWAILEELLRRPGQLVSPARLMTSVWGSGFERRTSYLRFHMTQLRRKLEDDPACPRYLLTERGMGYRYQPPSHRHALTA